MGRYQEQMDVQRINIREETAPDDTQYINGILRELNFTTITELLRKAGERDRPYYQAMAYRVAYPTLSKELGKRDSGSGSELRANSAYIW